MIADRITTARPPRAGRRHGRVYSGPVLGRTVADDVPGEAMNATANCGMPPNESDAVVEKNGRLTVQHTRQADGTRKTRINVVEPIPAHERFTEWGHE